ncbi:MAG: acylphosphatase [Actinomycetota bacterium]
MKAVHAVVRGRVQAVGFRQAAKAAARSRHLVGWVRNAADGTVEVWLQGEASAVDQVVDWLWLGPAGSLVVGVESDVVALDAQLADFFIRQ